MFRQEIVERVIARRGRLHIWDRLDPARTALLVIDMQGTFCAPGASSEVPAARDIVPAINRMAAGLRDLGGTVIWCTHANRMVGQGTDWPGFFGGVMDGPARERALASLGEGGQGGQLWPDLEALPGDVRITKNRFSALVPGASHLDRVLRGGGIDTLLIAGTKTDICCESTARDAMMLDYRVVMLSDANATLTEDEHWRALERVIEVFGDVLSVDEALARLSA